MANQNRRMAPHHAGGEHGTGSKNGILYPLDFLYTQAGVTQPSAKKIEARQLPIPYRSLLIHEGGMTQTLENHLGGRLALRTLHIFKRHSWYFRRVLLVGEESGHPIGIGAICMNLRAFTLEIRAKILRNVTPLGRILNDGRVQYRSRPTAFLAVKPNSEMMGVFWMGKPQTLYGRQTEVTVKGEKIGDIVEVLPPGLKPKR